MTRAALRVILTQRSEIPARTALEYELTESWPSSAERNRFWFGARVPSHLRFPPDPRKYLHRGAADIAAQSQAKRDADAEREAWQAARVDWLRSKANG
jgi:hypothetical protein